MKYSIITLLVVCFVAAGLVVFERQGGADSGLSSLFDQKFELPTWKQSKQESSEGPIWDGSYVRAPGKIEGLTETVELRSRVAEQILYVQAVHGQWVSQGDVLIELDMERLSEEHDLAEAMLEFAIAKKQRVENGARESEIEAAKQELESKLAPLWSAKRALQRGTKLFNSNAISQQSLDDLQANVNALTAVASSAQAKLRTIELPPRDDELSAATADVRAATSRLKIAKINLDRAQIRAPFDGRVLEVNARVGELTSPESRQPLIVMADTSCFHAIAEVDEFDALRVKIGQHCEITSDANHGILAVGRIIEVEPQMKPKQMYGQWAGERNDTFSREVKIALDGRIELPIGLPIDVAIQATQE